VVKEMLREGRGKLPPAALQIYAGCDCFVTTTLERVQRVRLHKSWVEGCLVYAPLPSLDVSYAKSRCKLAAEESHKHYQHPQILT